MFAELYEMENIEVLDAGRYGFVELKYYKLLHGFEEDETFTDSKELFEALWQEWFNTKLYLIAREMQLDDILYEKVFNSLPKEKQFGTYQGESRLRAKGRDKFLKCSVQRNKTVVKEALQLVGLFPCRQRFFYL